MNLNLHDKVFIISGSSRGIGKGIAETFLTEGAKVVLTGRREDCLDSTYIEFNDKFPRNVIRCVGDINNEHVLDEIEKTVLDEWLRIDGIVANAASIKPVGDWNIPEEDWNWYLTNNLKLAVCFVTKFVEHLKNTKGSIIIISSIAGIEEIGAPLPYSASKAALNMYSKGLAKKLARDHIRVNTIAPGNILFQDGNWDKKQKADSAAIQKMLDEKVPLNRFGSPEEIGCIAAFLSSEKAGFITGGCFVVDGGQTSKFI